MLAKFLVFHFSFLVAWIPFLYPLPIWDYWPWLLIPLCVGVSIVYKSIKCRSMRTVPREAMVILCSGS